MYRTYTPYRQNFSLNPGLCAQLLQLGLKINPGSSIVNPIAFNHLAIFEGSVVAGYTKIDAYSSVGECSNVINTTIGRYTSLAHRVDCSLADYNYKMASTSSIWWASNLMEFHGRLHEVAQCEWAENYNLDHARPHVVIGNDVWIGAHTMFTKSVTIGHGAVIGAGTIVTKDVPPYAVVVNKGGSQTIINYRMSDKQIE